MRRWLYYQRTAELLCVAGMRINAKCMYRVRGLADLLALKAMHEAQMRATAPHAVAFRKSQALTSSSDSSVSVGRNLSP